MDVRAARDAAEKGIRDRGHTIIIVLLLLNLIKDLF